ncbi:metal-dependent hydrolase [Natrinema versiforme]|uniref:Metal-dependent hydrolase n=1 Tax=Natrinema versiforme TaxID=88724 RepID=A0A4V1FZW3_9EURY|nr:metal-dependent hydrolase [Natrinema versiforme]QCS43246.1 metal-dependent hydrolase [Natrinema versiforme]
MWPWEHLAFAYVLYSLTTNVVFRRSPSAGETIAIAVGSQFPDLLDKPLAWTIGITETGYSVGHSIFVAPFICLAAYAVAARLGNRTLASAFSVALVSHPIADILNRVLRGEVVDPRIVLWPIASPPVGSQSGFIDHFRRYFFRYVHHLLTDGLTPQVAFQSLLGLSVVAIWLFDGAPVAADLWRAWRDRSRQ